MKKDMETERESPLSLSLFPLLHTFLTAASSQVPFVTFYQAFYQLEVAILARAGSKTAA